MFGFQGFAKGFAKNAFRSYSTSVPTKYTFSTNLAWSNMQTTSLLLRSNVLIGNSALQILNLREMLQKCKQECDMDSNCGTYSVIGLVQAMRCCSLVHTICNNIGVSLTSVQLLNIMSKCRQAGPILGHHAD